jgi:uncharacterized protein YndB with AHSA1/START domain
MCGANETVGRVCSTILINGPIERVFDYVTTPANWPEWHPSSLAVRGATDHSLEPGEQVVEDVRVAGRRGQVVWTVRERVFPRRWVIAGDWIGGAGRGTLSYVLTSQGAATRFGREFTYLLPNPALRLLDALAVRPRIEAESSEALRRLRQRLENTKSARGPEP